MKTIKIIWHTLLMKYNKRMYFDSLNERMKEEFWDKVEYHKKKIQKLNDE